MRLTHVRSAILVLFPIVLVSVGFGLPQQKDHNSEQTPKLLKMNSSQVFAFVERTLKNPKADQRRAEKFLQMVLDGKIHLSSQSLLEGKTSDCAQQDCSGHKCISYNPDTGRGFCSDCCIAASSAEKRSISQPVAQDTNTNSQKTQPNIASDANVQFAGKVFRNDLGCKRCVRDEIVCIKKDDKGECIHWKINCLEWETIPCQ
jgi:hypothetical protein